MQKCKSIYTTNTRHFKYIFGTQHNTKTELCHGIFQWKNERKIGSYHLLKTFWFTKMGTSVEKLDMLSWTLSQTILSQIYLSSPHGLYLSLVKLPQTGSSSIRSFATLEVLDSPFYVVTPLLSLIATCINAYYASLPTLVYDIFPSKPYPGSCFHLSELWCGHQESRVIWTPFRNGLQLL